MRSPDTIDGNDGIDTQFNAMLLVFKFAAADVAAAVASVGSGGWASPDGAATSLAPRVEAIPRLEASSISIAKSDGPLTCVALAGGEVGGPWREHTTANTRVSTCCECHVAHNAYPILSFVHPRSTRPGEKLTRLTSNDCDEPTEFPAGNFRTLLQHTGRQKC